MGAAKADQLGSNERIQEKIEKIKQLARAVPAVSSGDGAEVEGLRDALRAVQMRERELQQQLEDANMRVEQKKVANTLHMTFDTSYNIIIASYSLVLKLTIFCADEGEGASSTTGRCLRESGARKGKK